MPTEYEQQLIRIWADIKNTARYFGKPADEVFSDLSDMQFVARKEFPWYPPNPPKIPF